MLLVAIIYPVVGIVTAELARLAPSAQFRTAWRLAAWLLSLVVFVGHIFYEHVRLRSAVKRIAEHSAAAVALGAFVLAAFGPVRSHWGAPDFWRTSLLSLPLWPILTGVPAFVVALAAAAILRRFMEPDRSVTSTV